MPEQITIPFQFYWRNKMLTGVKTCTSRNERYGNPGDIFQQFNTNFIIVTINKYSLQYIAENLYREEGCDSPDEFRTIWMSLHPTKGWVPNQKVFVHFFRKE